MKDPSTTHETPVKHSSNILKYTSNTLERVLKPYWILLISLVSLKTSWKILKNFLETPFSLIEQKPIETAIKLAFIHNIFRTYWNLPRNTAKTLWQFFEIPLNFSRKPHKDPNKHPSIFHETTLIFHYNILKIPMKHS